MPLRVGTLPPCAGRSSAAVSLLPGGRTSCLAVNVFSSCSFCCSRLVFSIFRSFLSGWPLIDAQALFLVCRSSLTCSPSCAPRGGFPSAVSGCLACVPTVVSDLRVPRRDWSRCFSFAHVQPSCVSRKRLAWPPVSGRPPLSCLRCVASLPAGPCVSLHDAAWHPVARSAFFCQEVFVLPYLLDSLYKPRFGFGAAVFLVCVGVSGGGVAGLSGPLSCHCGSQVVFVLGRVARCSLTSVPPCVRRPRVPPAVKPRPQ